MAATMEPAVDGLNRFGERPIDLLTSRRSVLAAQLVEPGPDPDALRTMLEAAVRVPDHGRLTPWRLQVVGKAAQAELGELFVSEFARSEPEAGEDRLQLERIRPQRSPVLVVVSSHTQRGHAIPEVEQLLSCGNVCMNLLHAATALGFAAQWVTNWPAYSPAIKAALGIPEDEHLVGFVHIGTPKSAPSERARPDLDDVVRFLATLPPRP
jgi:nitroreductase